MTAQSSTVIGHTQEKCSKAYAKWASSSTWWHISVKGPRDHTWSCDIWPDIFLSWEIWPAKCSTNISLICFFLEMSIKYEKSRIYNQYFLNQEAENAIPHSIMGFSITMNIFIRTFQWNYTFAPRRFPRCFHAWFCVRFAAEEMSAGCYSNIETVAEIRVEFQIKRRHFHSHWLIEARRNSSRKIIDRNSKIIQKKPLYFESVKPINLATHAIT